MAKAKSVFVCPKCDVNLPSDNLEFCISCNARLNAIESKYFKLNSYFILQKEELAEKLHISTEKPASIEEKKEWLTITDEWEKWMRSLPADEIEYLFMDCIEVLKRILLGEYTHEEIQKVIIQTERIAELGQAVKKYLQAGGRLNDRPKPIPTEPGSNPSDQETNS